MIQEFIIFPNSVSFANIQKQVYMYIMEMLPYNNERFIQRRTAIYDGGQYMTELHHVAVTSLC